MKFRYAMVCSSNQNRSMEAHSLLKKQGFDVSSYGTGAHVKLPGPSLREPNVYDFGTPYKHMFEDLRRKDPELYPPPLPFFICYLIFNCNWVLTNKQTKTCASASVLAYVANSAYVFAYSLDPIQILVGASLYL